MAVLKGINTKPKLTAWEERYKHSSLETWVEDVEPSFIQDIETDYRDALAGIKQAYARLARIEKLVKKNYNDARAYFGKVEDIISTTEDPDDFPRELAMKARAAKTRLFYNEYAVEDMLHEGEGIAQGGDQY